MNKNEGVWCGRNSTNSYKRNRSAIVWIRRKTTSTSNCRRSTSNYSEWESKKRETCSDLKLNKRRSRVTVSWWRRSANAESKKRIISRLKLSWWKDSRRRWRRRDSFNSRSVSRNATISRRCWLRTRSIKRSLRRRRDCSGNSMFKLRRNTSGCLINRSRTGRESSLRGRDVPRSSWTTWLAMSSKTKLRSRGKRRRLSLATRWSASWGSEQRSNEGRIGNARRRKRCGCC